jgi:hypothetical protein
MAKRDEANTVPNACADAVTSKQPLKSYVPSMSFQMQPKIQSIMVSKAIGIFHYRSPYPEINAYLVVLAESRRLSNAIRSLRRHPAAVGSMFAMPKGTRALPRGIQRHCMSVPA